MDGSHLGAVHSVLKYLSNIDIDLSKVFFVIAFNDSSAIDRIVLDRMKIINIDKPSNKAKLIIIKEKLVPEILKNLNLKYNINIKDELLEYIINKVNEDGIRKLKKVLEKIYSKINYKLLIGKEKEFNIKENNIFIDKFFIDEISKESCADKSYLSMYT